MARYRKIDTRIWNDQKFNSLTSEGKLVFFFLLTHPHMTAIGAMRASLAGLAGELGWPEQQLREALGEAFLQGMVLYDEKASFIGLPNFLKYNQPESPNVIKSWEHVLDYLPECALKTQLIQGIKAFVEGLPKAFTDVLPEAFRKGMPNQEQEQEQEQYKKEKQAKEKIVAQNQSPDHNKVVRQIFDYWKKTFSYPQAKLDDERNTAITKALTTGYTVEQLCDAIQGCSLTPHNMGHNERGQRFDGLGVIFKDADNIDRFIRNCRHPPRPALRSHDKSKHVTTRLVHEHFDKHYTQTPAKDIVWLQGNSDSIAL